MSSTFYKNDSHFDLFLTSVSLVLNFLSSLRFLIISDSEKLFQDVISGTKTWDLAQRNKLIFERRQVWYPEGRESMKSMFRECATARLFLTETLKDEDAVIYIDTDFVFMAPPEWLWDEFKKFNSTQIASMTPCLFHYHDPKKNIYNVSKIAMDSSQCYHY